MFSATLAILAIVGEVALTVDGAAFPIILETPLPINGRPENAYNGRISTWNAIVCLSALLAAAMSPVSAYTSAFMFPALAIVSAPHDAKPLDTNCTPIGAAEPPVAAVAIKPAVMDGNIPPKNCPVDFDNFCRSK